MGLPALRVSWERQIADALRFGIEVGAEQLNRKESLSLTSVGIRMPLRWEGVRTAGGFTVSLDGSAGVRRISGHLRPESCGCVQALSAAFSFQGAGGASARWTISERTGVSIFAELGIDALGSGGGPGPRAGLLLSPQAGATFDVRVAARIALGLEARSGRLVAPSASFRPAVLGGEGALWMPLALLLTLAIAPGSD